MPTNLRIIVAALALCAAVPLGAQPVPQHPPTYYYPPPAYAPPAYPPVVVARSEIVVPGPYTPGDVVVVYPYTYPVPEPEAAEKCRYVADYWECVNNRNGGG